MKQEIITYDDICEYAKRQPWRFLSACREISYTDKRKMQRRRIRLLKYLYVFIHKRSGICDRPFHYDIPQTWKTELRQIITTKTDAIRPFSHEMRFVPYTGRPVSHHLAPVHTSVRPHVTCDGCACCGRHVAVGPPRLGLWVCPECRKQVTMAARQACSTR